MKQFYKTLIIYHQIYLNLNQGRRQRGVTQMNTMITNLVVEQLPVNLNVIELTEDLQINAGLLEKQRKAARKKFLRQQERENDPLATEQRNKKRRTDYETKKTENPDTHRQLMDSKNKKSKEKLEKLKQENNDLFQEKLLARNEQRKRKRTEEKEQNPSAYSEKLKLRSELRANNRPLAVTNPLARRKYLDAFKLRYKNDILFRFKVKERSRKAAKTKKRAKENKDRKRKRKENDQALSISHASMKEFLLQNFKWNPYTLSTMRKDELEAHYKLHNLYFQEYIAGGDLEETAARKVIERLCHNVVVLEGDGLGSKILNWSHFYKFRESVATKEKLVKAVYCDMGTLNHNNCEQYHNITDGLTYARSTISLAAANIVRGTKERYVNESSFMLNERLVKIDPVSMIKDILKAPGLSAKGVDPGSAPLETILFKTTTDGFALYDSQSGGLMNTLSSPEPEFLKHIISDYQSHAENNPYYGSQNAGTNFINAIGHCDDNFDNNKLLTEGVLKVFERYIKSYI